YGQRYDKVRYHAKLKQILGQNAVQRLWRSSAVPLFNLSAKSQALAPGSFADNILEPDEGSAADKKYIRGVDLEKFLLRVFPSPFRRNARHGSLDDFQQGLLHPFTRHIPRDRWVVRFPRDFIDLIYIDDSALRLFNVIVGRLQQV